MATLTTHKTDHELHGCGCDGMLNGDGVVGDAEDRGGVIGVGVYEGLLADRVTELERQMSDSTLSAVPGYRGWVLANVLSFLEGGHYGADYTKDQSDVARESAVHIRGAAFGHRALGGTPGATWRWFVPVAGSLSKADLAVGFGLREKTAEIWGPDAKPRTSEDIATENDTDNDTDFDTGMPVLGGGLDTAEEDLAPHVEHARTVWKKLYGADPVLKRVDVLDYERVPSLAVKKNGYKAWTNSAKTVYVAKGADPRKHPVVLETTLRHEAVHVRQFHDRGRPSTYENGIRYELEAYEEGLPRLEEAWSKAVGDERTLLDNLMDEIEATVAKLKKGLTDGAKKPAADRDRWYKEFLVKSGLLPRHQNLIDLYEPPKAQRNPSAAEAAEADVADEGGAYDAEETEDETGQDELATFVTGRFGEPPLDVVDGWDGDSDDVGTAEFVGSEHKAIGDAGSGNESSSISFGNPAQPLSFGDVVSLAGDYFDTYWEMRDLGTSASGRSELEWARWHCLGLKRQGVPEPPATEQIKNRVVERYLLLAGRNLSHFSAGGTGWQAYSTWHGRAIADALEAGQTSNDAVWRRALTKEAFGDHFLTDIFSAGHVRTPRAAIRDWYDNHFPGTSDAFVAYMARFIFDRLDERQQLPPLLWWLGWVTRSIMGDRIRALGGEAVKSFSLGDIVALALHDHDNKGLAVVSLVDPEGHPVSGGYRWTAVGDAHLGRSRHGAETKAMATAAVIASLRDLERVRGVGVRLGTRPVTLAQRADEVRRALGAGGFAARGYVPRESPVPGANVPLHRSDGSRAPLDWHWGQLGDVAYRAVDETVKDTIASELGAMSGKVSDPIDAPLGIKVYGTRNAFRAFVRHLHDQGITAIEKAVAKPAR
jgi:hypothetical protein